MNRRLRFLQNPRDREIIRDCSAPTLFYVESSKVVRRIAVEPPQQKFLSSRSPRAEVIDAFHAERRCEAKSAGEWYEPAITGGGADPFILQRRNQDFSQSTSGLRVRVDKNKNFTARIYLRHSESQVVDFLTTINRFARKHNTRRHDADCCFMTSLTTANEGSSDVISHKDDFVIRIVLV